MPFNLVTQKTLWCWCDPRARALKLICDRHCILTWYLIPCHNSFRLHTFHAVSHPFWRAEFMAGNSTLKGNASMQHACCEPGQNCINFCKSAYFWLLKLQNGYFWIWINVSYRWLTCFCHLRCLMRHRYGGWLLFASFPLTSIYHIVLKRLSNFMPLN